ncbi:hypothetical protein CaCOL14_012436 [Colletotrichum acutatum]
MQNICFSAQAKEAYPHRDACNFEVPYKPPEEQS